MSSSNINAYSILYSFIYSHTLVCDIEHPADPHVGIIFVLSKLLIFFSTFSLKYLKRNLLASYLSVAFIRIIFSANETLFNSFNELNNLSGRSIRLIKNINGLFINYLFIYFFK